MKRQTASIVVWRGKAYLPLQAQLESGVWMDLDPVYIADLRVDSLLFTINKIIASGYKRMPDPTREELRQRKDPILKATKARSWKALARNGASYSIDWKDDKIRIDMSYTDKKGRWQNDPEKVQIFSRGNTTLKELVTVILEDIQSRPEVWK